MTFRGTTSFRQQRAGALITLAGQRKTGRSELRANGLTRAGLLLQPLAFSHLPLAFY